MFNQLNIDKPIQNPEEFENFRDEVIRHYKANKGELLKYQREYKNLLEKKLITREDANVKGSLLKNIEQMRKEKDDIEAHLLIALAPVHKREYERDLYLVACHVLCQEKLIEDIKKYRSEVQDLEKQILRLDKSIYELNRKTVPDNQHQAYLAKAKKKLHMLENQLDVNKKREGNYFTENCRLRKIIIDLLYERAFFNKLWRRMINQLNTDKKYLVDLVEIAIGVFDNNVQIYQKLEAIHKKGNRDKELRKTEMQNIIRQLSTDGVNQRFLLVKGQKRELADLEPREYKRRQIYREFHRNKIDLYRRVIGKILSFSGVEFIENAIEKFQKQETLYYSYFNYTNELNYQITILNDCITELYSDITYLRETNANKVEMDYETIADLRAQLINEETTTKLKYDDKNKLDTNLEALFQSFYNMFKLLHCDDTPLMFFLGDHSQITIFNVTRFLKILEDQLNKVLSFVFVSQRKGERKKGDILTVRQVTRRCEDSTNIKDIVLAQQCPECAEAEEVNPYDEEFVLPLSKSEVKIKLREKVIAPEMQYRLHGIDECRLPRSRLLSNKKY